MASEAVEYSAQEFFRLRWCAVSGCPYEADRWFCTFHARQIVRRFWADRGIFTKNDPRGSRWRSALQNGRHVLTREELAEARAEAEQGELRALVARARARLEAEDQAALHEFLAENGVGVGARNAEVKELVKEIRKGGFKVVTGGKHMRVLDKKGAVVIDDNGPVIISSTPGDANWRDMAEARLRRAGVLKEKKGPQKRKDQRADQNGDAEEHLTRAEKEQALKLARQAEVKDDARARHTRTMKVRARLEPLVAAAGGWNLAAGTVAAGARTAGLGEIAELFSHRSQAPAIFPSYEAAIASVDALRAGGTLSDAHAELWEALVADWETSASPRAWYFERLREARGLVHDWRVKMGLTASTLPSEEDPPPAYDPGRPEGAGVDYPVVTGTGTKEEAHGTAEPVPLPSSFEKALRAVYLMARGSTGDDWEEILAYARVVANRGDEDGEGSDG